MATYLGAPAPSSIAIFAGPVMQERASFGASFADEADRITEAAYQSIAGADAAQGQWDWNAIGKGFQNVVGGLNAFLQGQQRIPTSTSPVGPGVNGPVTGQTPYLQPVVNLQVPSSAQPAVPTWVIGLGIVLALALAGWAVLGKKRGRR